MPTWSDKLVGEIVRLLLEALYDPQFPDSSHGFRKSRGCHTALREIGNTWTGTTWFIEGDIFDCFGSLDHDILLGILAEKIHDNRFLRLIRNMLKAGYLEDWDYRRGFKQWSQHLDMEVSSGATTGVDGGADGACGDAFARSSAGVAAGASAGVLGGDRAGNDESGRRGSRWGVSGRGHAVVPRARRHAAACLPGAVGPVLVVCRAGGDRALARAGRRGPRDRPSAGPVAVDDLARAAAQRRHSGWQARVPGHERPVACRPACAASQDLEAGRQRAAAQLRAGSAGRPGQASRRHPAARPGRCVDRPSAWAPQGPPLGHVVEPGADRAPLACRLSR